MLTHTDFDDAGAVFREAHRVLRTGGTFVYLGVHPCFGAPNVRRPEDGPPVIEPGYRNAGWQLESAAGSPTGIRSRVGINHLPLAALANRLIASGLTIAELEEPGDTDPPLFLAFRATKDD
jgi:hypothetical protein